MSAIFTVCKQGVCSQSFRMDATGHYNGVVGYVTSGLRALRGVSRFVGLRVRVPKPIWVVVKIMILFRVP